LGARPATSSRKKPNIAKNAQLWKAGRKMRVKNWKKRAQERKQWKEIIEQAKTHKEL
jgi:hypothetical protein